MVSFWARTSLILHNNESKTHWILSILSWNCIALDPVYTKTEPVRSTALTIVQHVHCRYNFRLWVSVAILTMLGDVHKHQQKQSKLERHSWQMYLKERQKCNHWIISLAIARAQPLNGTLRQFTIKKKSRSLVQGNRTEGKEPKMRLDKVHISYNHLIITKDWGLPSRIENARSCLHKNSNQVKCFVLYTG